MLCVCVWRVWLAPHLITQVKGEWTREKIGNVGNKTKRRLDWVWLDDEQVWNLSFFSSFLLYLSFPIKGYYVFIPRTAEGKVGKTGVPNKCWRKQTSCNYESVVAQSLRYCSLRVSRELTKVFRYPVIRDLSCCCRETGSQWMRCAGVGQGDGSR